MEEITHKRAVYDVTFDEETVGCTNDCSILSAARSRFLKLPYGCFNGGCGMCKVQVLSGDYTVGLSSKTALPDQERAQGYTLACKTYPLSNLMVRVMRDSS
ncbi:2Fe-2S iron-sulfur cluster binding domain-containing protein [Aneurinibacillus sp. BA2021]|nr:2Fe-2S iron-sulfur cluster binding domain-containing protein [Aneurinibacillus sp. BA2021]